MIRRTLALLAVAETLQTVQTFQISPNLRTFPHPKASAVTPLPLTNNANEGAPTESAIFARGCFWGLDSDWLTIPGVVSASVGYTGSAAHSPTYDSVCGGDGHTEAVRVEFVPSELGYEEVIRRFVEDPRVRDIYGEQELQYRVAIWADSEEQREVALRICADVGKTVPVLDAMEWFDAEDRHQNFFGC